MRLFTLAAVALLPAAAHGQCPSGEVTALHCTLSGGAKTLQVCLDAGTLRYAFGKTGESPDLALSSPLQSGAYVPWAGIGRSIYEAAVFQNDAYLYETWSAIERDPSLPDPLTAGVAVIIGEKIVANLKCDEGSITSAFDRIYQAMTEAGLCWNQAQSFVWSDCQ